MPSYAEVTAWDGVIFNIGENEKNKNVDTKGYILYNWHII